ncbi:MAG: cysteine hydrolase [Halanaerobiales bacterium]|nr:cysteine hydrolase [Halanaerobiales bacterium]
MNKKNLLSQAETLIEGFLNQEHDVLYVKELNPKTTAVIVVDIINGFVKEGMLCSGRVEAMIPRLEEHLDQLKDMRKVFFIDAHPPYASEFDMFPKHCIEGTEEAALISELEKYLDEKSIKINKNSTNGYLEPTFQKWLRENEDVENFIITGCCTDLCVSQFVLTLKTHFNRLNIKKRIILPMDLVETYHMEETNHPGDLMNLLTFKQFQDNGIELVTLTTFSEG